MAADLGVLLLEAFAKVLAGKVTEQALDSVLNWANTQAPNANDGAMTEADREQLRRLLVADRSMLNALKAQFRTTDRCGLLIVGPSGGGKSRILKALLGDSQTSEIESTGMLTTKTMRIGGRVTCLRDTVGLINPNSLVELGKLLKSRPPKVVCVVGAYGLLHTAGMQALHRPHSGKFPSVQALQKQGLKEEIAFVEQLARLGQPKSPVPHFLTFTNKLEHWDHQFTKAENHYSGGKSDYIAAMNGLMNSWGGAARHHHWAYGSAYFNVFPGKKTGPSAKVGREGSELSMLLLRALLHHWLLEG